ncbi:hypothetical protein RHMOL_Rhmol06G0258700 [Rhododendron molle]|uniref:Uncharacterized protein n=1 Tax=Rhododendron molle TaxID=49168 RepID=A0ACC0NHI8_RHOML|nr:hypothetical protein RHMOL_Rhmol06G0258700 [Rhododendron molle]
MSVIISTTPPALFFGEFRGRPFFLGDGGGVPCSSIRVEQSQSASPTTPSTYALARIKPSPSPE